MSRSPPKSFPIRGGEDLITPSIDIDPSKAIYTKNYECDRAERLRRIDGIEAFDGQPAPSDQSYWILDFDAGTAEIAAEDLVTGASSSDTGIAVIAGVVESGSYVGNDAAGYLVLTQVDGTFTNNENLQVSAATKSVADGVVVSLGADTPTLNDTYLQAAIEYARAQIGTVTATDGNILGIAHLGTVVYTWKAKGGGIAGMYKSTTAGWVEVDKGINLTFVSGGTYEVVEGDTIEGAISGATATVERISISSGTWAAGTAAGLFTLSGQTGTFQAETLDVGANTNVAGIAADSQSYDSLDDTIRVETINHNFVGGADGLRMYGVHGSAAAEFPFEFDGTVYHWIRTPNSTVGHPPSHIAAFKDHLFLLWDDGLVEHSATGNPNDWTALGGASSFSIQGGGVGLLLLPGGVLGILSRDSINILYGNDSSDWEVKTYSPTVGAIEWTVQPMLGVLFLSDSGVTSLSAVDAFGDFGSAVLSKSIKPLIDNKKSLAISSMEVRDKEQYRLFFSDNTGLYFTFNSGKLVGITRVDLGLPAHICYTCEISGEEYLLIGSDDNYIYRADKGNSLNGSALATTVAMAYNHLGSPEYIKNFHKAVLGLTASSNTSFTIQPQYDYGQETGYDSISTTPVSGSGTWDGSTSAATITPNQEAYISGAGQSIGLIITSTGTYDDSHTLESITLHFSVRGIKR